MPHARSAVSATDGHGCHAAEWAYGGEIHNATAYTTESIWIWFARGLVPGTKKLDEGEFVEILQHSEADLVALDWAGQLPDVKTRAALHWLQAWRAGTRPLQWAPAQDH